MLIGESAYRGQGFAKEAVGLMIHFGFTEMNLNRICLEVYADNAAAV
jgi:RimJ/RimL family protein N-acetyltransferase